MNVLHKWIEAVSSGLVRRPKGALNAPQLRLVLAAREDARNAICFDMGDLTGYTVVKLVPELFKLPFPICWFEGSHGEFRFGLLAEDGDQHVLVTAFVRKGEEWFLIGLVRVPYQQDNDEEIRYTLEEDDSSFSVEGPFMALCLFLSALNCVNVSRALHEPDIKLQRARSKRGRQPLFSYWTLEIDLSHAQTDRESMGGTHASPRLHLRRGHSRQFAPGKYCWVQPHVVGNKRLGMIHKDYAVSSPPSTATTLEQLVATASERIEGVRRGANASIADLAKFIADRPPKNILGTPDESP